MKFGFFIAVLSASLSLNAQAENSLDQTVEVVELDRAFVESRGLNAQKKFYEVEPVSQANLKILGKGLSNKWSGAAILLACIGENDLETTGEKNCKTLRHVYISADGQRAYYFGNPIVIVDQSEVLTQKKIKTTLRKLSKSYAKTRFQNLRTGLGVGLFYGVGGAGLIATMVMLAVVPGGPLWIITPAAVGIGFAFAWAIIAARTDMLAFMGKQPLQAMRDQNGWNWSVSSRKISNRNFWEYASFLNPINDYWYDQNYNAVLKKFDLVSYLKANHAF